MNTNISEDVETEIYDIYQDESKEDGYWYGFLLVPQRTRQYLLDVLNKARANTDYANEIHYHKLVGTALKAKSSKSVIIRSWISIGIAALQQQKFDKYKSVAFLGKYRNGPPQYEFLKPIRCKFILLRAVNSFNDMYPEIDPLKRLEIVFSMGLTGGLNFFTDSHNKIMIDKIFIDGDEQYAGEYHRKLDKQFILNRVKSRINTNVYFSKTSQIIAQDSNHHKIDYTQKTEDSYLLQLCDILIGGIRFCWLGDNYKHKNKVAKRIISSPCQILLDRTNSNFIQRQNSRFYKGFTLSDACIENDIWHFRPMISQLTVDSKPLFLI